MRNEDYKPIPRDDRTRRLERPPVNGEKGSEAYLRKIKPIRPDAPKVKSAEESNAKKTKANGAQKPLPRGKKSDTPAMDALIRKSEAEEMRKRREAEQRRRDADKRRQGVGSSTARPSMNNTGSKAQNGRSKRPGEQISTLSSNPVVSRMILSVASVAFLLLILWLMASFFIDAMYDRTAQVTPESSSIEESDTEAPQETSTAQSSESAAEFSSEEEKVKPLTEGDADYQKPDTWIGKTFLVEDDANVRSDGGTQNPILFTVNPGDQFMVKKAKMVDDAAWVQGIALKKDGTKQEGWIYSYCLGYQPQ